MDKFTIKSFNEKYPHDAACLDEIFSNRYGSLKQCPACDKTTKFHRVANRKCYACQFCGYQLHPLADTIFHKSETSLKSWFYAIFLFANSKNGVSAKELERQLGVTYKTAWRMAKQIRLLLNQSNRKLSETVEVDETYVGGVRPGKRGRGAEGKTAVVGMVQRRGQVIAKVVSDTKSSTIRPIVREHVELGAQVMTDDFGGYRHIGEDFKHRAINHSTGRYANGLIHTNTIEGFWSQLKRSINGTYHAVSPKYLQLYVDEFSYRYSHRDEPTSLFFPMVAKAAKPF